MMRFAKRGLWFAASLAIWTSVATPVPAAERIACLEGAAAHDLQAKRVYQTALNDLVHSEAPQFAELVRLNMELQIALAEARHRKLLYLLRHAPERLTTDAGLAAFANFDWSAEDDAALSERDPAYGALSDKVDRLTARNDVHSDWPALRALFRDELARSEPFKEITASLMTARSEAEARLAACAPR